MLAKRSPARMVLDELSNYDADGENASYETLNNRLTGVAERIIDDRFAGWFKRHSGGQLVPKAP